MSVAGQALAECLKDYLAFRSASGTAIRIILTDYPSFVLEDALRHLVRSRDGVDGPNLVFQANGRRIEVAAALMQSPKDIRRRGILAAEGYEFGAGPDYLVRMRNVADASLIIAVPPELLDLCHESLKSNSFQPFHENQKFGGTREVFGRIAQALAPQFPVPTRLADALRWTRSEEVQRFGADGDDHFFARLENLAERLVASADLDLRIIGLLPHRLLGEKLAGDDTRSEDVRKAVAANYRFQADLVAGLAGEQLRYVRSTFSSSPGLGCLESYLASWNFRLDLRDEAWREAWPRELLIEDLQSSQTTRVSVRVRILKVHGVRDVLGVPVVSGDVDLSWSLHPRQDVLVGTIVLDGETAADDLDLTAGTASLPAMPEGLHAAGLRATGLAPGSDAYFFVPGASGNIVATVDDGVPGRLRYAVAPETPFRVRWALVDPPADLEGVFVRVVSSQTADEGLDVRLESPTASWYDFPAGIEQSVDVVVETYPTVVSTSLRIDAVEPAASDVAFSAPLVSRALLRLAEDLALQGSLQTAGQAEVTDVRDDRYEVRFVPEDDSELVSLPCLLPKNGLLETFEQTILDTLGDPWPKVVVGRRRGRGRTWTLLPHARADADLGGLPPGEFAEFMRCREAALAPLRDAGGVGRVELSRHIAAIRSYALSYRNLLSCVAADQSEISRTHRLIALVDSVLISTHPALVEETEQETALDEATSAILVAPTHPLRLLWLAQLELKIREMLESNGRWSVMALRAVDSKNFPACLVDLNLDHFHAATTASDGRWSVLLREGEFELDRLIPAQFSSSLRVDSPRHAAAASPSQLSNAIVQYQELHPYREVVRIAYANPGSGEKVLEAMRRLVAGKSKPSSLIAADSAAACVFELEMVDLAESPEWTTGAAFRSYAADAQADEELLERLHFSVRHAADGQNRGARPLFQSHIAFGSDVLSLAGQTLQLDARATSLGFGGLLLETERDFEPGENPRVVTHCLVARPPDWGTPLDPDGRTGVELSGALLWGISFGLQAISAAMPGNPNISQSHGRTSVASVAGVAAQALDAMHEAADWVYIMDSRIDVEYFDSPDKSSRFVIDYQPRLLSGGDGDRQHNYVVTSSRTAPLKAAINRFIYSAYPREEVAPSAGDDLATALNRISGRLLLYLTANPAWAKGAVGLGLVRRLYEAAGLLDFKTSGEEALIRLLIPVDDYVADWSREARRLDGGSVSDGSRADLLDVAIRLDHEDLQVVVQVIEVKNRKSSYSAADLRSGPLRQVSSTRKLISTLFGVGSTAERADVSVRDYQLAQLLDFYVRRSAMQQFGADADGFARAQEVRARVRRLIVDSSYSADFRKCHAGPLGGSILHFNANSELRSLSNGVSCETIESGGECALYLPFGLEDILLLMKPTPPEGLSDVMFALDPWTAVAASPTRVGPEVPEPTSGASPRDQGGRDSGAGTAGPMLSDADERADLAFAGFIGNSAAVLRLRPYLVKALRSEPRVLRENIAFTGPASTGKTMLAKILAGALGLRFIEMAGSAVGSLDNLLGRMEKEALEAGLRLTETGRSGGLPILRFPAMIVFVDEAHEISRKAQDELLTLLEPSGRRGVGKRFIADVQDVTFIFATTEWGDIMTTLQTRLGDAIRLDPYDVDEVAEILSSRFPEWPRDVRVRLATAGRRIPRVAIQLANEFSIGVENQPERDLGDLLDYYRTEIWKQDDLGLNEQDRRYLRLLDEQTGPIGTQRVAEFLGIGQKELTRDVEPYLIRLGLIVRSASGRQLADAGKAYLRRQIS